MEKRSYREAVTKAEENGEPSERYREYLIHLSQEDKQDVARQFWQIFKTEFFLNAGKGVVNVGWKLVLGGLIFLAGYGSSHGWFR